MKADEKAEAKSSDKKETKDGGDGKEPVAKVDKSSEKTAEKNAEKTVKKD